MRGKRNMLILLLLFCLLCMIMYYPDWNYIPVIFESTDNISIYNGYYYWNLEHMCQIINNTHMVKKLNRNKIGLIIEWYGHNIVYMITYPFTKVNLFLKINEKAKNVDLERKR